MSYYQDSAQAALLEWANLFPLERKAASLDDLTDGVLLSQILQNLDPSYDASQIERNAGPSTWLHNKRNLQAVYKGLFKLVRRDCPDLERQTKLADFRAIAEKPDAQGISQLIAVMLAVALLRENNEEHIQRLQTAIKDPATLTQLMKIVTKKKDEMAAAAETADHNQYQEDRDFDLAFEEEKAHLLAELEKRQKHLADTETRLGYLQESYDELKDEANRKDRELEFLKKTTRDGASDSQIIKALENKIREQDELIANQETEAENDRVVKRKLQKDVDILTQRSQKAETLDDEVKELRHQNEELSKRANIGERYKQKLEGQKNLQTEMQNLLYEKESLQQDLAEYQALKKRNEQLELTSEQYIKKLHDYELQHVELESQRRTLREDMLQMRMQLVNLEQQRGHDERVISELQEQINAGGGPAMLSPTAIPSGLNLEQELNEAGSTPNFSLEISRLKAENNLLRTSMGSTSENARLRQELEEEQRQRKRIQADFNEIFEKHQVTQAQISAVANGLTKEGDEAFTNLKVQLLQAQSEIDSKKRQMQAMQAELADKSRDLLSAKTDLSAVEKDSVEALQELKSTDKFISASLREELDALRQTNSNLVVDLDARQKQLIETLIEKDQLRSSVREPQDGPGPIPEPTGHTEEASEALRKASEKIEKLRDRLKERQQQIEKAEQDKYDLQRKLKATQDGGASAAQKAASDLVIKNLQRENALIATAWYDLTGRLQSNHVVLQRRNDAPRSWLNKQRQMVNATPRK